MHKYLLTLGVLGVLAAASFKAEAATMTRAQIHARESVMSQVQTYEYNAVQNRGETQNLMEQHKAQVQSSVQTRAMNQSQVSANQAGN